MTYLSFDEIQILSKVSDLYCSSQKKEQISGNNMDERFVQQYELDFFTEGTAKLIIDNVSYTFEKNSICFRKPGQYNQQILDSHYSCYNWYFSIAKKDTGELLNFSDEYTHFFNQIPTYAEPDDFLGFAQTIETLSACYRLNTENAQMNRQILTTQLAQRLYLLTEKEANTAFFHPAVRKAISYILHNIETGTTATELAEFVGLSPQYFHVIFKKSTGKTVNEYIVETHLNYAKDCLLSEDLSIAEVAYLHGFSSCAYFNYVFKKHFHQTPGQFRKSPLNRKIE